MSKKIMFGLIVLIMLLGCQSKQKNAREIPLDSFVKMYVSALREDSLMKQYQKPESYPEPALDSIGKMYGFSSIDFKHTYRAIAVDPVKKVALDSLLKQAIEAEAMKSLNEKEIEKN
ncbi:hypothetical protein JNL27_11140 [bacterium]|nr:hypothetical protein [bacterium]